MATTNLRHVAGLLLMAWLTACGGGGDSSVDPPPPPAGRTPQTIAFSAGDGVSTNGSTEMYSIADDGSGLTALSTGVALGTTRISDFAISPDGRWVAYLSDVNRVSEYVLYVAPISGGTPVRVSRTRSSGFPSVESFQWSPDSSQLVYAGNLGGGNVLDPQAREVFLVNRDGSNDVRINGSIGDPVAVEVRNPRWSPDGRYILQEVARYDRINGASANAYALNIYDTTVGTANSRRLVTSTTTLRNARWSPDSTRISYMADQETQSVYRLYTIGVSGSSNTRVTEFGDFNSDSRWSPDGSTLAYLDHPSAPFPRDLVVSAAMPGAADTVLVFVSPNDRRVWDYAWSPDGSQLAYTSDEAVQNRRELYVINADGSGSATRINGPLVSTGDVFGFAWSPDGNRIAYLADQDTDTLIDLYVSSSAGTNNTWISSGMSGEEVFDFAWSDDSRRLAFSTGPDGRRSLANKLYVGEPDGSGRTEISDPTTTGPLYFAYD